LFSESITALCFLPGSVHLQCGFAMNKYLVFFILLLVSCEGGGMSLSKSMKICVFSGVTLRLLREGKPIAGTKVIRRWEWGKEQSDEAYTGEDGMVSFSAIYESSKYRCSFFAH